MTSVCHLPSVEASKRACLCLGGRVSTTDYGLPVETYKTTLSSNVKVKSNVDWLTEVTKRFTDAWLERRDLLTVSMKSPMRLEKVR